MRLPSPQQTRMHENCRQGQTDWQSRKKPGSGKMRLTVADLMTEHPVTVSADCSADAAIDKLSRHRTNELYVTDESGHLLGVVPDFELLKAELSGEAQDATVEQLMSRSVPVFSPQSDAAEVARLFRDGRFTQFPVVSGGRLIGLITRGDVVRLMAVLRRIDSPATVQRTGSLRRPKILTAKSTRRTKRPAAASTGPAKRSRRPTSRSLRG